MDSVSFVSATPWYWYLYFLRGQQSQLIVLRNGLLFFFMITDTTRMYMHLGAGVCVCVTPWVVPSFLVFRFTILQIKPRTSFWCKISSWAFNKFQLDELHVAVWIQTRQIKEPVRFLFALFALQWYIWWLSWTLYYVLHAAACAWPWPTDQWCGGALCWLPGLGEWLMWAGPCVWSLVCWATSALLDVEKKKIGVMPMIPQ